jgi:hypothetical protein
MLCFDHRSLQGPDALMAQPDSYEMVSEGIGEIDGRPATSVRFKHLKDKRFFAEQKFSFEPARGYLPVRAESYWSGKRRIQTFVTEVRSCSGDQWFPEHTVQVATPDRGDFYDIAEIQLLELDADKHPAPADFAIDLPAGTNVSEQAVRGPAKSFTLKQNEKIQIESLPELADMLDRSQSSPLMNTAIHHPFLSPWQRRLGIIGGLALAVAAIAIVVIVLSHRTARK